MELTVELNLSRFFHQYVFFVTSVACEIQCLGATESTNSNLYDQTDCQRELQDVVAQFPGEEQISNLKQNTSSIKKSYILRQGL